MKQKPYNDRIIARYLLGELPEEEQVRLEEKYFIDADFFERCLIVEDQLIDDYLRTQLSGKERGLFESQYLLSPRRRERVEMARALIEAVSAGSVSKRTGLAFLLPSSLYMRAAMAAAAFLVFLGAIWLIVERVEQQDRAERLQAEQQAEQPLADATAHDDAPPERTRREPEKPDSQAQTLDQKRPQPRILSLVLSPGLQRDGGSMRRIVISKASPALSITLNFDAEAEYGTYDVVLKRAEGDEVWRQSGLRAKSTGSALRVAFSLSSRMLDRGEYIITLSGSTLSGDVESIEDYAFSVIRPLD